MNDQQLCEIVHQATASAMYPRGTHSGETMAVARAVRSAVMDEVIALIGGDLSDCSTLYIVDRLRELSFQPHQ